MGSCLLLGSLELCTYMCVFVCYMYILHIQICKRLCVWAVVLLVLLSCVCTCICLYVVRTLYVYEYPRDDTCVLLSTFFSWGVYVCVCMCTYVYVCVCMCMYVYLICILYVYGYSGGNAYGLLSRPPTYSSRGVYVYSCICMLHVYDVRVDIQGVMRVSCYHGVLRPPRVSMHVTCTYMYIVCMQMYMNTQCAIRAGSPYGCLLGPPALRVYMSIVCV